MDLAVHLGPIMLLPMTEYDSGRRGVESMEGNYEVSGGACTALGFCGKLRSPERLRLKFYGSEVRRCLACRWGSLGNSGAPRDSGSGL